MDSNKDRWVKLMTMGDVSFANMLKSAIDGSRCRFEKGVTQKGPLVRERMNVKHIELRA